MNSRPFIHEIPGAHLAPPAPAHVADLLCKLAARRGVDRSQLLRTSAITEDTLSDPENQVPATDYAALIYHALDQTKDPCFGIELGVNIPPTMFGFLGLALMCANDLREALDVGIRYAPLGSRYVDIIPSEHPNGMFLTIQERMPLGFAQQFAIESTIATWLNCAQHLGGHVARKGHLQHARVHLTWSRPPAFARYEKRLPPTLFDQQANQIFIPHHLLNTPLKLAQPLTARRAREQCEKELTVVKMSQESFTAGVAEALALSSEGFPHMPKVAERMGLSSRTLARRLERQGVNFREVVNERRRLEAMNLLRSSRLNIDEIGLQLGYLNPANFTRAFKRWTGETPSQYRQRSQTSESGE